MAWARKRTEENDTRKENFAPAHASGPRPGQAGSHLPIPSTPTASAGSLGEGPSPHSPWTRAGLGLPRDVHHPGRLELRQRPISTIKEQPGNPRPERESAPAKVTAGAGTPYHSPTQPSEQPDEEAEGSGDPGPKSGVPRVPPSGEELQECPSTQRPPSRLGPPAGAPATHPGRGTAAPGPGRPPGGASCLRGRVVQLSAAEAGRRNQEHAPGARGVHGLQWGWRRPWREGPRGGRAGCARALSG